MAYFRRNQIVTSSTDGRRYRVGPVLGAGGYGEAYRATPVSANDRRRGPDVCLKVTKDQASWHREAYFGQVLSKSPRVISVLDSFPRPMTHRRGGAMTYCLVTELAENGSLIDYVDRLDKPWSEARIRREVVGLLRVLDLLHYAGATHRDITPANVLVTERETLKLGDFGIARHGRFGGAIPASAFNQWFVDTPIALGDRLRWDSREDVWQMGQILGMLVTTDASAPLSTREIKTLDCSDELKGIIRLAIGSRTHRFPDAYEMTEALRYPARLRRGGVRTLRDRVVVFTGRLKAMSQREASALARKAGAKVATSVTWDTHVVVSGSSGQYIAGTKGLKLLEAEALCDRGADIRVIDEAQFLRVVLPSG
jgi:serine/threonine protein kinase